MACILGYKTVSTRLEFECSHAILPKPINFINAPMNKDHLTALP